MSERWPALLDIVQALQQQAPVIHRIPSAAQGAWHQVLPKVRVQITFA